MNRIRRRQLRTIWARACSRLIVKPCSTARAKLGFWWWGALTKPGLIVKGRLRLYLAGQLMLGHKVSINSGWSNYVGGYARMGLYVGPQGRLSIGDRCGLSNTTIVCMHRIDILENTLIGGGCAIYDTDFHELDTQARNQKNGTIGTGSICIGPNAFVGGHCIILKNVTIGEGAVIGAGSVVTRSVPPFQIWAGVPARFVRDLHDNEREERKRCVS